MSELRVLWPPALAKASLMLHGYYPGRNVWDKIKLPREFSPFSPAQTVLAEFGGIKFGGPGNIVAFEPSNGDEEAKSIHQYETLTGRRFYPLGFREHQDREYLIIDTQGIIFLLADGLKPYASHFDRALQYLVWRIERKVYFDSDLSTVGLVGKSWYLTNE